MTFDELWVETWKQMKLPSDAKSFIPQSLTEKTKERIMKSGLSPAEIAIIIERAVEKINHGFVESIDNLVVTAKNE